MNRFSDSEVAAVYRAIAQRRDVRHFLPDPIDPTLLYRLLEAAHLAPSVGFMQPWRFIRITNAALRQKIYQQVETERRNTALALGAREDEFMRLKVEGVRECGELLVATLMDRRDEHIFGRRTLPEMDLASVACAIQNLWLAARAEGIGMGWVSLFDPEILRQTLNIPDGGKPVAILCLGHVEAFYPRPMLELEGWATRQQLSSLLFENTWGNSISTETNSEKTSTTMKTFNIQPVSTDLIPALRHKIDNKTKPLGALGKLEQLAFQIGAIQNSLSPTLNRPVIMIFAGDHGITAEGVSPYPQAVTQQMVMNFLNGGAAINVFAKQNGLALLVVDAGVNHDFEAHPQLINAKIDKGTRNFLHEAAMTLTQCQQAIAKGAELVRQQLAAGSNVFGFGEMGIGNTSAAAILMSLLCELPLQHCVGRGTGLDDTGIENKRITLECAIAKHGQSDDPMTMLTIYGGFEIAMMVGAMLQAAESGTILLIDGFIVTAALLVAAKLEPTVLDYCIFAHQSDEAGHAKMLAHLNAEPLLNLGMRLGEGTGAAIAYPLLQASLSFLNNMASFDSAGVSKPNEI